MPLAVSTPPSGVRWRCFRWLASALALSARFLGLIARFTAPISRPKAERRSDFLQGLFLVFYPSCFGIWGFTAAGQYRLFLPRVQSARDLTRQGWNSLQAFGRFGEFLCFCRRLNSVASVWRPPSMSELLDEVSFWIDNVGKVSTSKTILMMLLNHSFEPVPFQKTSQIEYTIQF